GVVIEDTGAVLAADVGALAVQGGGVVKVEEDFEDVGVGDLLGVELDFYSLGVAGLAGADFFVGGIAGKAAGVAGADRPNAAQAFEHRLGAPEAASGQSRFRHRYHPPVAKAGESPARAAGPDLEL